MLAVFVVRWYNLEVVKGLITNPIMAKYAAMLLRRGGSGLERLSSILMDARVDMQPHQVLSAVEALDNPWSKGRMLCDQVGLGKTVQAGIVVADMWHRGSGSEQRAVSSEQLRSNLTSNADTNSYNNSAGIANCSPLTGNSKNIIVVVPAMLKEQWAEELQEKFYLPTQILGDSPAYGRQGNEIIRHGEAVQICSYQYCYNNEKQIAAIKWDMVVMDEAHFLRNLHTGNNVIAASIARLFKSTYKLLLTASPLQNSLLDLYSLASLVNDNLFLDLESFKEKFVYRDNAKELAERLGTIMSRTLKNQVLEYINYTDRYLITQEFELSDEERELYEAVLKYCDSKDERGKYKVTGLQRMLFFKELASSPRALLESVKKLGDRSEELGESDELYNIIRYSSLLTSNSSLSSKLKALDEVLKIGFANLAQLGATQKAVIFTESLATQKYIAQHLLKAFDKKDVLIINGGSTRRHEIIDDFKHRAKILVSTEVAGQGLNLQFCSMVINYDLPYNPQKIEQRIGRCHRYGQKHDVCVVNLLSKDNYAEARLYELLTHKLKLFEGVFGASDLVLGILEDVDFEKRISEIYSSCRTKEQIDIAFEQLQLELAAEIKATKDNAKQKVFDYLEKEVVNRFKGIGQELGLILGRKETLLWELTKYIVGSRANFSDKDYSFIFGKGSFAGKRLKGGIIYRMDKGEPHSTRYRLGSPLAQKILTLATYNAELSSARAVYKLGDRSEELEVKDLIIKLDNSSSLLIPNSSLQGTIGLYRIKRADTWDFCSDIVLVGRLDNGTELPRDLCEKILMLQADNMSLSRIDRDEHDNFERRVEMVDDSHIESLQSIVGAAVDAYTKRQADSTIKYFEQYKAGIKAWAIDKKERLQKVLKGFDNKIEALKKEAAKERNFTKKLALLDEVKKLESEQASRRLEAMSQEEQIINEQEVLIAGATAKSNTTYKAELEFVLRFEIVS